ncbi:MAG: hypothetical protein R2939_09985 [Kofleriaceae bacterium]
MRLRRSRRSSTPVVATLALAAAGCLDVTRPASLAAAPAVVDAERPPIDAPDPCGLPAFTGGLSTVAGCQDYGDVDGPRGVARFYNPVNAAVGPGGDVYVTDFDNHLVRVVTPAGEVRTLVRDPRFTHPFGIAFAGTRLYVETDDDDLGAHSTETGTIWEINLATGEPTVIVRDLGRPRGIVALPDGRLVLADHFHHVLRILDPLTQEVTLLAGAFDEPGAVDAVGADALRQPTMSAMPDGRIVTDQQNRHWIRRGGLDGTDHTLAGTGWSAAPTSLPTRDLARCAGAATDGLGTFYITDPDGLTVRRPGCRRRRSTPSPAASPAGSTPPIPRPGRSTAPRGSPTTPPAGACITDGSRGFDDQPATGCGWLEPSALP